MLIYDRVMISQAAPFPSAGSALLNVTKVGGGGKSTRRLDGRSSHARQWGGAHDSRDYLNMDESKKGALRRNRQGLRADLRVGNILHALRTELTGAEYSRILDREDNISRVDELIEILLTKENRHFDAFCTALEQNGYVHLSGKLQNKADEIEG